MSISKETRKILVPEEFLRGYCYCEYLHPDYGGKCKVCSQIAESQDDHNRNESDSEGNSDAARDLVGKWAGGGTLVYDRLINMIAQSLQEARDAALKGAVKIVRDHYWDSLEYSGIGKAHAEGIAKAIEKLGEGEK